MTELAGGDALIAASTAFALTITKIVDFVRNMVKDKERQESLKWLWGGGALVLGLLAAFVFEINVFAEFSDSRAKGALGTVLTGLGMGATGSAWHEVLDAFSSSARRSKPPTATADR